jgi:hypothetical protein
MKFGSVEIGEDFLVVFWNGNKLGFLYEISLDKLSNNLVKMLLKYGLHFEKTICWSKISAFLTFL